MSSPIQRQREKFWLSKEYHIHLIYHGSSLATKKQNKYIFVEVLTERTPMLDLLPAENLCMYERLCASVFQKSGALQFCKG